MDTELPEDTDMLVIGAGPGGYVAALRAAEDGVDIVLVDALEHLPEPRLYPFAP